MKIDTQGVETLLAKLAVRSGMSLAGLASGRQQAYRLLLACAARAFATDRDYSEAQVNAALRTWLGGTGAMLATDHVELRRLLVDARLLERDGFGRRYRRTQPPPRAFTALLAALAGVDADHLAREARDRDRAQREARREAFAKDRATPP